MIHLLLFVAIALSTCHNTYGQRPAQDLITNLPGLDFTTNYSQYSGYLDLTNDRHYHYWLTESQNDPDNDPVVVWLTGGPGCSSMLGLLYELGPFHVNPNGSLYDTSKYSWNNNANILFLESPVCVGFSYQTDQNNNLLNCSMNDTTTAQDNYQSIVKFLDKFPIYASNDWYVTGESYGGVYVPMLANNILLGKEKINLKGFAVGNGVSYRPYIYNSRFWYLYHHGMISEAVWNAMLTNCCSSPYDRDSCPFDKPANQQCTNALKDANANCCSGVNLYNIYGPCYHYNTDAELRMFSFPMKRYETEMKMNGFMDIVKDSDACLDNRGSEIYLNQMDVRRALHIAPILDNMTWNVCVDKTTNPLLNYTAYYTKDMRPIYNSIFESDPNVFATIYNGDTDAVCCFLGDEWFVDNMNLTVVSGYREWYYVDSMNGRQVAGWTQDFDRGGGLHFATVRGSGHLVPQFAPQKALKLFQYFLQNKPLN